MTRHRSSHDGAVGPPDATETSARRLWALVENAAVEGDEDGVVILSAWGEFDLGRQGLTVEYLLRRMTMGPVSLANADSAEDRERLESLLDGVSGTIVHCLALGGRARPVVSVVPVCHPAPFAPSPPRPYDVVRLSRWASVRPVAGALVISAPTARHEVLCEGSELGALLARLATSRQISDLIRTDPLSFADGDPRSPAPDAASSQDLLEVVTFLLAAGVAVMRGPAGTYAEDLDAALRGWTPFELEFDVRSRREDVQMSGPMAPIGPGATAPPPTPRVDIVLPLPMGDTAALAPEVERDTAPDVDDGVGSQALGSQALGSQALGSQALGSQALGELLDRSLHLGAGDAEEHDPPWPGLELYLAVARGHDLPRGVHHVDASGRVLRHLADQDDTVNEAVAAGRRSFDEGLAAPCALLLIAAERRAWPGTVGGHAASLVRAGALTRELALVGRRQNLSITAVPLTTVAAGWTRLVSELWPAQTPVGACRIVVGPAATTG